MKITDALLAEHVVFHTLFEAVDKHADEMSEIGEVKSVTIMLEAALHHHGKVEDEILMPVIDTYLQEIGHYESFHEEHEAIDGALASIRTMDDPELAKKVLKETIRIARAHFDREERVVFSIAEKHISEESLHSLGEQWQALREV